jgi:DNA-binding transcriptional ArsR family regulator
MDILDLIAHPIRLRIVHALSGGRTLTTRELCARMPDVAKASAYRHVGLLADAGILEVDAEHRVRGAVERRYRLRRERAVIDAKTAASLSPEQHRRGFAAAMASLIGEFNAYLDRPGTDPAADAVGYRQHAIWLSPEEREGLISGMRGAIVPFLANPTGPNRTLHLLSPILFPIETQITDPEADSNPD